jgi:catechol 2,3-dioxygenase-like lactoylglutathione lyase family enzyme
MSLVFSTTSKRANFFWSRKSPATRPRLAGPLGDSCLYGRARSSLKDSTFTFREHGAPPFYKARSGTWKIDHAGVRVEDIDTAITWYVETLDFRLVRRWSVGERAFGWLSPAGSDGFIVELPGGFGTDNRSSKEDLGSSLKLSFRSHLGFHVESVDDTIAELTRRGVTIISEPHDVAEVAVGLPSSSIPGAIFSKRLRRSASSSPCCVSDAYISDSKSAEQHATSRSLYAFSLTEPREMDNQFHE